MYIKLFTIFHLAIEANSLQITHKKGPAYIYLCILDGYEDQYLFFFVEITSLETQWDNPN